MTSNNLKVVLAAVVLGTGCSQIIGLSDYDIDPRLDDSSKSSGGDDTGQGGEPGQGGDPGQGGGGKSPIGNAGMGASEPEAGSGPMAGASPGGGGAGGVPGDQGGAGGEAQGGGGSGEVIPCDTPECCESEGGAAVSEEVLLDGGFEAGPIGDGDSPWFQDTTSDGLELIAVAGNGWAPRAGTYFVYLSGIAEEESYVYSEDYTVPEDAGWFELSGYRRFQIDTQDDVNGDYSFVAFAGYGNDETLFLFDWGATGQSPDGWGATASWTRFTTSWAAAPYRGQVRYITLGGVSDDYTMDETLTASSYLYDELSLKVVRCYR